MNRLEYSSAHFHRRSRTVPAPPLRAILPLFRLFICIEFSDCEGSFLPFGCPCALLRTSASPDSSNFPILLFSVPFPKFASSNPPIIFLITSPFLKAPELFIFHPSLAILSYLGKF